jgi:hypothetical protein
MAGFATVVRITGTSGKHEERVRYWVEAAIRELEWDGDCDVTVEDPLGVPQDQEAWGRDRGVTIRPSVVRGEDRRPGYVLAEEVAHVRLGELGVPHGTSFGSRLCQELFATWFQYRMILVNARFYDPMKMTTNAVRRGPVSPQLGGNIGKHLGAALAGSPLNRREVDEWLKDPSVPDTLKGFAQLLEILPGDTPPSTMATMIAQFYTTLDDGVSG